MKRMACMSALALAVGIALGVVGNQVLSAQPQPGTSTILQKDLEGVAGREVIMYRVEPVPGAIVGRHYHPGPEVLYILEGALILERDGQSPVTLQAGESAYIPAKHIHSAKNASTTEPAKVLVFMIVEKGQPLSTPAQ